MCYVLNRSEVSQLEKEKQELLKELRLAESRSNQTRDEENIDTLVTLVEAKGKCRLNIASGLVGTGFASRYWLQPRAGF